MSDLTLVSRELRTTSLIIAEKFGKNHRDVLKAIRNLECSDNFKDLNFQAFKNNDLTGENTSHYEITRDGFMFLVMGFTGKRAVLQPAIRPLARLGGAVPCTKKAVSRSKWLPTRSKPPQSKYIYISIGWEAFDCWLGPEIWRF